ncbi:MAG: hypothetical protein HOC27_02890, partial [Phycisphaerae bacterium]|nr:hypothetical protein [Phycisphaerae bacterium]
QRPQGGGLASAFGGAGGGGTETVFGGRVGDALTVMTVVAFVLFLGIAVSLNLVDSVVAPVEQEAVQPALATTPDTTSTPVDTPADTSSTDDTTGETK